MFYYGGDGQVVTFLKYRTQCLTKGERKRGRERERSREREIEGKRER